MRNALIALLGLALCISISATQILGFVLILDLLFRLRDPDQRRRLKGSVLLWPIIIFVAWGVFSTLIMHPSGLRKVFSLSSAFLFYFLALSLTENQVRSAGMWFCWGAALAGLWGLLQKLSGANYLPTENVLQVPAALREWPEKIVKYFALRNDRAVGSRSHPLTYAESLLPAFFLWAYWIWNQVRSPQRSPVKVAVPAAGWALVAVGLVMAQGRAVLLGLLMASPVFGLILGRRAFITITSLVAFGFLLVVGLSPRFRERMLSIVSFQQGSLSDQQSKSIRLDLWGTTLRQIARHPFLGSGCQGVSIVMLDPIDHQEHVWSETHNIYLQNAVEWGLVGLGLFLWILILVGKTILRIPGPLKAPLLACWMAFLIAGLTESWTNDKEITMLFWFFAGCAELLARSGVYEKA